jgi:hypothetical protein
VLSLAGGALGVALSYWITTLLDPIIPEDLFKIGGITLDRAVLGFSLFVTLLTPIAFGLMPALSASRLDLTLGLKEGWRGPGRPRDLRGGARPLPRRVGAGLRRAGGPSGAHRSHQGAEGRVSSVARRPVGPTCGPARAPCLPDRWVRLNLRL